MPGRPEFSQPGTRKSGETVAVNSRPDVKLVDETQNLTIPVDGNAAVEVYAPTDSVYNVRGMVIRTPDPSEDGATTGTLTAQVKTTGSLSMLKAKEGPEGGPVWANGVWKASSQEPANEAAQVASLQAMKATDDSSFRWEMFNNTDVEVSGEFELIVVVEEVSY